MRIKWTLGRKRSIGVPDFAFKMGIGSRKKIQDAVKFAFEQGQIDEEDSEFLELIGLMNKKKIMKKRPKKFRKPLTQPK